VKDRDRLFTWIALLLLCLQTSLPWTARHFVTQDGPSHIYGTIVTWDLLTHAHSSYGSIYRLQPEPAPTWTTTVILRMLIGIAGPARAEQLLVSLLFIFHFVCYGFACRCFASGRLCWSPVANVLIQTYFLTRGYYNFQLGMDVFLLLLGYGVGYMQRRDRSGAVILGLGSVVLYFTHILPTLIAVITLTVVAGWLYIAVPFIARSDGGTTSWNSELKNVAHLLVVLCPGILLGSLYAVLSWRDSVPAAFGFDWRQFPTWLFHMSGALSGHDGYLYAALGALFVAVMCSMKAREWRSPCGGLAVATVIMALLSVFGPDTGFGGGEIKVRLVWTAILMGGVLSAAVSTPRILWTALCLCAAIFTVSGLIRAGRINARLSSLTDSYISALGTIPPGSNVVRLAYPMPDSLQKAGIPADLLFVPLLHTDSYAGALKDWKVLTDFQAITRTFPVVFRSDFAFGQQRLLELLEAAPLVAPGDLRQLLRDLPVPVDYVVILGDDSGGGEDRDLSTAISIVEASGKRRLAGGGNPPFVRIFH
jgi:hypothetical protein